MKAGGVNEENSVAVKRDPTDPRPREEYLSWDEYFMALAFLSAKRSKDPNKQVGACLVNSNNITVGMGYNGFPRGCPDDQLPWAKKAESPLDTKYPYVVHAEANAILNKNVSSLEGTRMFVTMFPCNECTKLLIQAGIAEVIYHEDKVAGKGTSSQTEMYEASRRMLQLAGVKCRQYRPQKIVVIDM